LKIDGARAYDLARAGEAVVMKSRMVTIHALAVTDWQSDAVTLSARVSKGTYIRSLARDIARAVETVGHVTMLRRTRAGPFTLEQAISLDKLEESAKGHALEDLLLPLTAGLDDIPALPVTPDQARALREGRKLIGTARHQGLHLAISGNIPIALVEVSGPEVRVVRGFNIAMSRDD
jgi:tRNA pseudouridine55 synthase